MSKKRKEITQTQTFTITPVVKERFRTQEVADLFIQVMIQNNILSTEAISAMEFILNSTKPTILKNGDHERLEKRRNR